MQAEMLDNAISNSMQLFADKGFKIRVIMRLGDPWFVAKDVCDCLDLANSRDAVSRLDDDEKGVGKADTLGGSQDMMLISESGLYTLVMRSNKPEAKVFRKWVTSEVLPSIRKTGSYGMSQISRKDQLFLAIIHSESEEERAGALKELEEINKQKVKALTAERDEAVRTKTQYQSNLAAQMSGRVGGLTTSLNRVKLENDLLTTENSRLRQDYVENKDFCKQLRAQKLVVYVEKTLRDKCSKALQELSALMEIPRLEWKEFNDHAGKEVPRYAYHKDVCAELKQRILDNPNYLKRFK